MNFIVTFFRTKNGNQHDRRNSSIYDLGIEDLVFVFVFTPSIKFSD